MATALIVIADDNALVRVGLRSVLGTHPDLAVVAEAADAASTRRACARHHPDVLVIGATVGDEAFPFILAGVRALAANCRCLVHGPDRSPAYARGLIMIGVEGYIADDDARESLTLAVRSVAAGGTWFARPFLDGLASPGSPPGEQLTAREYEVLSCVATGKRNAVVARDLGVTESTVEFHLGNIFTKFDTHSRLEAVRHARRHGLLVEQQATTV